MRQQSTAPRSDAARSAPAAPEPGRPQEATAPSAVPTLTSPGPAPIQRVEWATDGVREEAKNLHAAHGGDFRSSGEYTMHHKVAKSRLAGLAAIADQLSTPAVQAFKAKVRAVTHSSARAKGLSAQLANMPMNLEYGPASSHRTDDPGEGFDPNTEAIAEPQGDDAPPRMVRRMSVRSLHLKKVDDILRKPAVEDGDWAAMTDALDEAHQVHAAGDHLSAPRADQWVEAEHGVDSSSYHRVGNEGRSRPENAGGHLKAQAAAIRKKQEKEAAQRQALAEAAAAKRREHLSKLERSFRKSNTSKEAFEALRAETDLTEKEVAPFYEGLTKYRGRQKKLVKGVNYDNLLQHFGRPKPKSDDAPSDAGSEPVEVEEAE